MKSFKKTVGLVLILAVLASGVFLPNNAQAQEASFGDVAEEWGKNLGLLAAGDITIRGICFAYAWGAEHLDVKKFISDSLVDKGIDKLKEWGEKMLDKIKEEGEGKIKELVGGAVPVKDVELKQEVKEEGESTRATTRYEECRNFLRDVVLSALKKRMLDRMTDMTIAWIQGKDSEPMFVTDPKGFYKQTINEVAGQLIEESRLANLCYEPQRFRIEFLLTTPKFSEQISCTLDQVIDNVTAFRDDFRNGSWIAYQEVLKPQNNRYGIETIVEGERQRREYEASLTAQYELGAAGGFLGQKRCTEWKNTETGNSTSSSSYYTQTPDGLPYTGRVQNPTGSVWRCVNPETVTPGQVASEAVAKSIGSEFDFIINAEDLAIYGAAILDTVINQLIMKGIESGQGLFAIQSHEESKQTRQEEGVTGCDQLDDPQLRFLCEKNSPNEENLDYTIDNVLRAELNSIEPTLEEASSTLREASSTLSAARQNNEELINGLFDLANCQIEFGLSGEEAYDENAEDKYYEAVDRRVIFDDNRQRINGLEFRITNLQENLDEIDAGDADTIFELSGDADTALEDTVTLTEEVISLSNEINTLLTGVNQDIQSLESDYPGEYPACAE